jgi:hypothetical protein
LAARHTVAGVVTAIDSHEIAILADMPLARVIHIQQQFTWDEITMGDARKFCAACQFDPTNTTHRRRQFFYLRTCQIRKLNHPPRFLTRSPSWQTELLPLIRRLQCRP